MLSKITPKTLDKPFSFSDCDDGYNLLHARLANRFLRIMEILLFLVKLAQNEEWNFGSTYPFKLCGVIKRPPNFLGPIL